MAIASLKDLRPGDIMIAGQSEAPAKLLVYIGHLLLHEHFRIGRFAAGHVGIVVDGGMLVEAMPSGARIRKLVETDWSPCHAYFRLPENYAGQHLDVAAVAKAMVGIPYSFMSYAYLGLYLAGFQPEWLAKRIDRRQNFKPVYMPTSGRTLVRLPVEAICSVLGDQAWTLTGYKIVEGTRPQVVTPGILVQHLWDREGIIKGIAKS